MTGDQDDRLTRLRSWLPNWFGSGNTPLLDAALSGPANVLAWVYGLVQYAILQTRITTATGGWLDLTARDFFGRLFQRRGGEPDTPYRARIIKEMFRSRVTRPALVSALTDLTGRAPVIFEPARIADTGVLGGMTPPWFALGGAALPGTGVTVDSTTITMDSTLVTLDAGPTSFVGVGGLGSLNYPNQFFVTAFRPPGAGVPSVAGLGIIGGANNMPGGLGNGAIELANLADVHGPITDLEIYTTIDRTIAAGVTAWTNIQS